MMMQAVSLKIDNCNDCPFRDHSGAFTPGGPKPVCQHQNASDVRGPGKRDPYHWKHRVLNKDGKIPDWCPIELINKGIAIAPLWKLLRSKEEVENIEREEKEAMTMQATKTVAKVKPIREIRQPEMQTFLDVKAEVDALKKALEEKEKQLESIEQTLIVKVEQGWQQEQGRFVATINVTERRNVGWKAVVFRRLGAQIIDDETTACVPTQYRKLLVLPRVEG